jgi:hypothetical protein
MGVIRPESAVFSPELGFLCVNRKVVKVAVSKAKEVVSKAAKKALQKGENPMAKGGESPMVKD